MSKITGTLDNLFKGKAKKFRGQIMNPGIEFFHRYGLGESIIIPDYQRVDVWTLAQRQELIRSIFYEVPVPSLILNKRSSDNTDEDMVFSLQRYVIDGGQRLRALNGFFNNNFSVDGFYWKDLTVGQKGNFLHKSFSYVETRFKTEDEEREYYILFNNSGTEHSEDDIKKAL